MLQTSLWCYQWWIQGFPDGCRQIPKGRGRRQSIIQPLFFKNCMKMKNLWPGRGERASLAPPWIRHWLYHDIVLVRTFTRRGSHLSSAICCLNQSEVSEVTVAGRVARGTDDATAAHLAVTSAFCSRKIQIQPKNTTIFSKENIRNLYCKKLYIIPLLLSGTKIAVCRLHKIDHTPSVQSKFTTLFNIANANASLCVILPICSRQTISLWRICLLFFQSKCERKWNVINECNMESW